MRLAWPKLDPLVWDVGRRLQNKKQSRPHSFSFPLVLSRAQGENSTAAGQGST